MGSSGGILRGQLRPVGGRTPPFLLCALLVFIALLSYNYWNLSTEYNDLVERMSEIQDQLKITALKRDIGEKQIEGMQAELRKVKLTSQDKESNNKELRFQLQQKTEDIKRLNEKIKHCEYNTRQLNFTHAGLEDLKKKVEKLILEKEDLFRENSKLSSDLDVMKVEFDKVMRMSTADKKQKTMVQGNEKDMTFRSPTLSNNAINGQKSVMPGETEQKQVLPQPILRQLTKNSELSLPQHSSRFEGPSADKTAAFNNSIPVITKSTFNSQEPKTTSDKEALVEWGETNLGKSNVKINNNEKRNPDDKVEKIDGKGDENKPNLEGAQNREQNDVDDKKSEQLIADEENEGGAGDGIQPQPEVAGGAGEQEVAGDDAKDSQLLNQLAGNLEPVIDTAGGDVKGDIGIDDKQGEDLGDVKRESEKYINLGAKDDNAAEIQDENKEGEKAEDKKNKSRKKGDLVLNDSLAAPVPEHGEKFEQRVPAENVR